MENKDELIISNDIEMMDIDMIHHFISTQSYWALNIPKERIIKSIQNSICFGVFIENKQVGFARVISDKATFAYLADVFILPEHRGKGLSKRLLETIHLHPDLQRLRRWMLATKDAHSLYEQFGWMKLNEEQTSRLMVIQNKNPYSG